MVGRLCSLEPLRDSGMGTVEHRRAGLQCSGLLTPTSTGTDPPLFALSTELFVFNNFYLFILFIFGCVGSSLLRAGSL